MNVIRHPSLESIFLLSTNDRQNVVASSELTGFNYFQLRWVGMERGFFTSLPKFPSSLAERKQEGINDWRTREKTWFIYVTEFTEAQAFLCFWL